jgi:hypothetical protein
VEFGGELGELNKGLVVIDDAVVNEAWMTMRHELMMVVVGVKQRKEGSFPFPSNA